MSRRAETITEIARVFIDALGKQIDPDHPELIYYINLACKAHRLGHTDRYHNQLEYLRTLLRLEEPRC